MNSKDLRKCFKRATSAVKHGTLGALSGLAGAVLLGGGAGSAAAKRRENER